MVGDESAGSEREGPPRIYTSSFGNLKNLLHLNPVGIARGIPKWYRGRNDRRLAPSWGMLKMSKRDYDRLMFAILEQLAPEQIADDLGDRAVMLCWEPPGIRCHRRLVAEWLESALDIVVPEVGFDRDETPEYQAMPRKGERPPEPPDQLAML